MTRTAASTRTWRASPLWSSAAPACSVAAGRSSASLIGALIVNVFNNGLALAGVDPNYQVLAIGILVIAAVTADQWIRSVKS